MVQGGEVLLDQLIAKASLPKGGFLEYEWGKPGHEVTTSKLSYVRGIQDWKWIIGTGVYLEDIDNASILAGEKIRAFMFQEIAIILMYGFLILLMMEFLSSRLSKRISTETNNLLHSVNKRNAYAGALHDT